MRRVVPALLLVAALPLSCPAADQRATSEQAKAVPLDESTLQGTVHASDMLDQRVRTSDGREIGKLIDVTIMQNGKVKEYLVAPDVTDGMTIQDDATQFADDVADYDEPPLYEGDSQEGELHEPYLPLPPHNVTYNQDESIVEINLEERSLADVPRKDRDVSSPESGVYVRELLGMEAHLADLKAFGEVKEILLSSDGRKVAAYVVESFDDPYDSAPLALPSYDAKFLPAEKKNAIREDFGIEAIVFPFGHEYLVAMPRYDTPTHTPVSDERN